MLFTISSSTAIALPDSVKGPEGLLNVITSKAVPTGKSFVVLARTLPPKTNESPAAGAVPPQLAGVLQKPSLPPPVQVRVAAFNALFEIKNTARSTAAPSDV